MVLFPFPGDAGEAGGVARGDRVEQEPSFSSAWLPRALQLTPREEVLCAAMDKTQVEGRVFRVGDVATASGVTVRTLHYYEEVGLLVPQRTEAGHRAYSSQDVERLSRIWLLRRMGLPLSAVSMAISKSPLVA